MVFDILVAGSGNNLAAFLVALMTVFAVLAGLTQIRRDWTPALAQGGAMFAVAAPMLPAPDWSLAAMSTRVEAVCVGFLMATGLFGLISCLTPPYPRRKQKNNRRDRQEPKVVPISMF